MQAELVTVPLCMLAILLRGYDVFLFFEFSVVALCLPRGTNWMLTPPFSDEKGGKHPPLRRPGHCTFVLLWILI